MLSPMHITTANSVCMEPPTYILIEEAVLNRVVVHRELQREGFIIHRKAISVRDKASFGLILVCHSKLWYFFSSKPSTET
jgi:hypothetical protein